jgi:benzoyl-CoA reductase/2-hydroxyglutaryl-CoA dehydratase subunit BcrC/BadD/HgdB
MKTIAYCSPFVPPEWIAAHGLRPHWLRPRPSANGSSLAAGRGICPYAGSLVDAAIRRIDAAALVLSTACDQMRYAAALLDGRGSCPIFLLNVPSTWQTPAACRLYRDELRRLGRFLEELGGRAPANSELAECMLRHDSARRDELAAANSRRLTPGGTRNVAFRSAKVAPTDRPRDGESGTERSLLSRSERRQSQQDVDARRLAVAGAGAVSLAIVGGPLLETDDELFDLIEQCGGRVVLDATEGGERTLPRPFDPARLASDPLQELADAYFDSIPDAFRRPNTLLYEWLGRELASRHVRGIVFRRYAWCDLWHGELERLRQWAPMPVLDIDAGPDDTSVRSRLQNRIEAFLETLP